MWLILLIIGLLLIIFSIIGIAVSIITLLWEVLKWALVIMIVIWLLKWLFGTKT